MYPALREIKNYSAPVFCSRLRRFIRHTSPTPDHPLALMARQVLYCLLKVDLPVTEAGRPCSFI